jgi:hypothetical protein
MSALATDSLEPYRTIFSDHRTAFLDLAAEIEDVTGQNRRLAERGAHDVEPLMAMLGQPSLDLRLAQSGYRAVVGATARLTMPSLVDWLK